MCRLLKRTHTKQRVGHGKHLAQMHTASLSSAACTPINCRCPVREVLKSEHCLPLLLPHPATHPPSNPLLSLSLSLSRSIAADRHRHLQPFYAGRTQSCRERSSLVTWAEPAAAARPGGPHTGGQAAPAKMVKRKSLDDNEPECGKGIPFPIQTFLWRQTRSVCASTDNRCLSLPSDEGGSRI